MAYGVAPVCVSFNTGEKLAKKLDKKLAQYHSEQGSAHLLVIYSVCVCCLTP